MRAAPSARRALADSGLAADEVKGSGRGGRISKQDVTRALEEQARPAAPAPEVEAPPAHRPTPTPAPTADQDGARERVVPMSPLRKTVARRLVEAQHTAAILTTFNEIDMSSVLALRERHQERFVKQYGIKLGFMSFFVKAAIDALKAVPGRERRGARVGHRLQEITTTSASPSAAARGWWCRSCATPIGSRFAEVEVAIAELAARARDNKLTLKELRGWHLHHLERRRLRLAAVDADPQPAAERNPRPARDPEAPGGRRRRGRRAADDVRRALLRSPARRRPRGGPVPVRVKECVEDPERSCSRCSATDHRGALSGGYAGGAS